MAEGIEIVISATDRVSGTLTRIGAQMAVFGRRASRIFTPWHVALHLLVEGFIKLGHVVGRVLERAARRAIDLGRKFFTLKGQITAALASLGIGFGIKAVVDAGAYFDALRANLRFLLGDAEAVESEVKRIIALVKTTPFELQSIASARQELLQFGFLTEETFNTIADAAAARQKDVTAAVDAVVNATQREFQMLKDFGILTRQTGTEIQLFFKDLEGVSRRIVTRTDPESILTGVMAALTARFKGQLAEFQGLWGNLMNRLKKEWLLFKVAIADLGVLDAAKRAVSILLAEIDKLTATEGFKQFTRVLAASFQGTIRLILRGLDLIKKFLPLILDQVLKLTRGMEKLGGISNLVWSYLLFGGGGAKTFLTAAFGVGQFTEALGGLGTQSDRTRADVDSLISSMSFFGGKAAGLRLGGPAEAITSRIERLEEMSLQIQEMERLAGLSRAEFAALRFPKAFEEGVESATGKLSLLDRAMLRIRQGAAIAVTAKEFGDLPLEIDKVREAALLLEEDMKRIFGPTTKLLAESFEREWTKVAKSFSQKLAINPIYAIYDVLKKMKVRSAVIGIEETLPTRQDYNQILQDQAEFKLAAVAQEQELRAALQEGKVTGEDLFARREQIATDLGINLTLIEQLTETRMRNLKERLAAEELGTPLTLTKQDQMLEDEEKIIRALKERGVVAGKEIGNLLGNNILEGFKDSRITQLELELAAIGTRGLAKQIANMRVQMENELEQFKDVQGAAELIREKFERSITALAVESAEDRTKAVRQIELTALEARGEYEQAIRARAEIQKQETLELAKRLEEDLAALRVAGAEVSAEAYREVEALRVHAVRTANKQIERELIQHNQKRRQLTEDIRLQRARIADLSKPTEPDWGPLSLFFGFTETSLEETEQRLQEFRRRSEELVQMFSGAELREQQRQLAELFRLDELEKAIEERKRQVEEFAQYFADQFATAFSQISSGQKSVADAFGDMVRMMIQEFQRLIIRAVTYKAVLWAISKISATFPRIGTILGGVITAGAPGGPAAATAAATMSRAASIQVRTSGIMARSANIIIAAVKKQDVSVSSFGKSVREFAQAVRDLSGRTTTAGGSARRVSTFGGMPGAGMGGACCQCTCTCVVCPEGLGKLNQGAQAILTSSEVLLDTAELEKEASAEALRAGRILQVAAINFGTAVGGFSRVISQMQQSQGMQSILSSLSILGSMGGYAGQYGFITRRPTFALIGEGGEPEAVVPLHRAKEFGFGGGVSINQTLVFGEGGVADTVDAAGIEDRKTARLQSILKEEWIRIAIEQMRPGGILDGFGGGR